MSNEKEQHERFRELFQGVPRTPEQQEAERDRLQLAAQIPPEHYCRPARIDCPVCSPEAHRDCGCASDTKQQVQNMPLAAGEPLWVSCRVCNLGGHICPGCGVDVPHEGPRTCTTCTQQIERGER